MNTRTILLLAGAAGVAGVGYYYWKKQHPTVAPPPILHAEGVLAVQPILTASGTLVAIPPKPVTPQTPKDIANANLQFTGIGTQAMGSLGNYAFTPPGALRRYR